MFKKEIIDASGLDWKDASAFNEYFFKLKQGQVKHIKIEGDLMLSKLAWKITIYSQAIRYRLIELIEACVDEWDKDRFVTCLIIGRAIIETVATLYEFEHSLEKALTKDDVDIVDALIMNRIFGTRLTDLFDGKKAYESVNVLTVIEKLDKLLGGYVLTEYYRLSEYAHTNYLGVSSAYQKIDYHLGDVSYGNQYTKNAVFERLQGVFGLLEIANITFKKIESHVKTTADLQAMAK